MSSKKPKKPKNPKGRPRKIRSDFEVFTFEHALRTGKLPLETMKLTRYDDHGRYRICKWDKQTPEWRAAQSELYENICADIDRQKMELATK
jgi:hypothetical protein